jgi:hypothetical protein
VWSQISTAASTTRHKLSLKEAVAVDRRYTNTHHLFFSERLIACSDEAKLHYSRIMLTANSLGRLDLSPINIRRLAYPNFHNPPSDEKIDSLIAEYHQNHLVFVYQDSATGTWWGQFLIPDEYLPGYKYADDKRTPAPDPKALEAYQRAYYEEKQRKSQNRNNIFKLSQPVHTSPDLSQSISTSSDFSMGVVVGVGVVEEVLDLASVKSRGKERESSAQPALPPDGGVSPFSIPSHRTNNNTAPTRRPSLDAFAECYNQHRGGLLEMRNFTDERKRKLRNRIRNGLTLDLWRDGIVKAAHTDFCAGKNSRKKAFTIDNLLDADTFTKLMEGAYGEASTKKLSAADMDFIRGAAQRAADTARFKAEREQWVRDLGPDGIVKWAATERDKAAAMKDKHGREDHLHRIQRAEQEAAELFARDAKQPPQNATDHAERKTS